MSTGLINVSVEFYSALLKEIFYAKGYLFQGTTQELKNVEGAVAHFRKYGLGLAVQRQNTQSDIIPMDTNYEDVPVTLQNWYAGDYSDIFDQQKVNFSEVQILANVVAGAIGRRYDQQHIDALSATPNQLSGLGPFTYARFLAARKFLRNNGALQGNDNIYAAISAEAEEQFMKEIQVVSGDFTTAGFIDKGGLHNQTYSGVKFIVVPDMATNPVGGGTPATGGLPLDGVERSCFMWNETSMGWAMGMDVTTSVDWIPEKQSQLVLSKYIANGVLIDDRGALEIPVDETPAVSAIQVINNSPEQLSKKVNKIKV